MGTDIHGIFQKRNLDGTWEDVLSNYTEDRHYALFAWLGNVRNGFGFAGCLTHSPITPLSDNEGLPEDFEIDEDGMHPIPSNAHRGRRAEYYLEEDANPEDSDHLKLWMGDHSFSWLSADDILQATPPKIRRTGIVPREFFDAWDGKTAPERWIGGISGLGVVVQTPETLTPAGTHVQIEWDVDTAESFAYFIDEVRRLKEEHGDVRFVFGFDS